MRYEAVGNNLHGALAGEDHREDDFNFFLKRNRVNNLPWSVDCSWCWCCYWCWDCCWLTRNSLTAVVSLLGVGWKTARQRHVPQIAAKMNACERRDWNYIELVDIKIAAKMNACVRIDVILFYLLFKSWLYHIDMFPVAGPQCEITASIPCLETPASSFVYS